MSNLNTNALRGTYNHPLRHILQPTNGYSAMEKLNFVAPMAATALTMDNGSGMPAGMPAGSVMSVNNNGRLIAGAVDSAMPMFLLYNSWDPDGYVGYMTSDGQEFAAASANSAGMLPDNLTTEQITAAGANWSLADKYNTSGSADSEAISRIGSGFGIQSSWNGDTVTHTYGEASGNYTVWPASCGMELGTSEFDVLKDRRHFTPGTMLTSPAAAASPTTPIATNAAAYYQQKRGGYVTPVNTTDTTNVNTVNVCGVVSRGMRVNENGVTLVYFHACYKPRTDYTT